MNITLCAIRPRCRVTLGAHMEVSDKNNKTSDVVTNRKVRAICHGRLSRDQVISVVRKYEKVPPVYTLEFYDWLRINLSSPDFILYQHKNKKYWLEYQYKNNILLNESRLLRTFFLKNNKFDINSYIRDNNYYQHKYFHLSKGW
jgi:hypothetical protein